MKSLIPRVKVNYTFGEFLFSLFVGESSNKYRNLASQILGSLFDGREIMLTGSGRIALYKILKSLPQKKVMIPAYTCPVVAEAAISAGKEIRYIDTDISTFNSNNYKDVNSEVIVIATHQYGYPCNTIKKIAKICKEKNAVLIEDSAASINTFIDGQRVGTFGDYAILSFNHSKQITVPCGGGCIIAKTSEMLNKIITEPKECKVTTKELFSKKIYAYVCLLLKNKYLYRLYYNRYLAPFDHVGKESVATIEKRNVCDYQQPFAEWQSFLLVKQLKKNKKYIESRKRIFKLYEESISNPLVKKPILLEDADISRYVILVEENIRTLFYQECIAQGVDVDFSHIRIAAPQDYKAEHRLATQVLNLPLYYNLSIADAKKIIKVVNKIKV